MFIAATSKTGDKDYEEILRKRKKYLAAGFGAISAIIFIAYWIVVYGVMSTSDDVNNEENKKWKNAIKNMVTTMFIMFLVAHITTLTLLIIRLKARVPEFYKVQRKQVIVTTILLISTIISKVILRLIFYNKDFLHFWNTSRVDHTWFYPLFMFFTAYFEYFGLFASILLSLKNNMAP